MGGDGGSGEVTSALDILRCFTGRDVFKHDFEFGKITAQRNKLRVNKNRLSIKKINLTGRYFAVYQEQQSLALHRFKGWVRFTQIRDAGVTVGRRPSGVEFDSHNPRVFGPLDFVGR